MSKEKTMTLKLVKSGIGTSIMNKEKTMTLKLVKSGIGRMKKHKLCIKGLGFKKLNHTVTVLDTPSNRGLVNKISDMIEIQEN